MKKSISIIGGGASALVLASELDSSQFDIHVYEKNTALGRKFLVAGEGGLNFTHSEDKNQFINRYTPFDFLQKAFLNYSNTRYIEWMNALEIETYVGTSGRSFPKRGIKPIQVLEKILNKIRQNKVQIHLKHEWKGFSKSGHLLVQNEKEELEVKSDYIIFCLGGASWPVTGSSGNWLTYFKNKRISVSDFQSSNCAFKVNWEKSHLSKIEGKILKNISISCGEKHHAGEIVLTKFGIEGSGIYPLSPQIREELNRSAKAMIYIDLKPSFPLEKIRQKLHSPSAGKNLTNRLKEELNLSDAQIILLKAQLSKDEFLDLRVLAERIKRLPLTIEGLAPIEEAISTVGGIDLMEINENFELKKLKNNFVIGEMLNYDAPTGGYLLQSCFSMAMDLASHLNTNKA